MNNESLKTALNSLVVALNKLDESKIDQIDKLEIMMNVERFLDPENYSENIGILQRETLSEREKRLYKSNVRRTF